MAKEVPSEVGQEHLDDARHVAVLTVGDASKEPAGSCGLNACRLRRRRRSGLRRLAGNRVPAPATSTAPRNLELVAPEWHSADRHDARQRLLQVRGRSPEQLSFMT
jgi:hypothetical protein